eukprot:543900_1
MALVLTPNKLDYIDDHTKLIITGYIRNLQESMTDSCFKYIPSEITTQILFYVDDHFIMYRGSYKWKITDSQLIENILSSQPTQFFRSDIFEIFKLQFLIQIYPNSSTTTNPGQFELYIHLLAMPTSFDNILVNLKINFIEFETKFITTVRYRTPSSYAWGWQHDTVLLNDIITNNPKSLTFIVCIKILNIITKKEVLNRKPGAPKLLKYQSPINNYSKNYNFDWIINKNNQTSNRIFSDIIGEIFCAFYCPTDHLVALKLCGFPNYEQCGGYCTAIQIKWTLHIIEIDIKLTTSDILQCGYMYYDKLNINSKIFIPSFEINNYKQFNSFTFVINIQILKEYDFNGNIIGNNNNNNNNNNKIQNEWDKFINNNNNNKIQ